MDSGTFWIFVISGVVGFIIIIALIILFCRIRKANKEIVSEVEVMKQVNVIDEVKTPGHDTDFDFKSPKPSATVTMVDKVEAGISDAPSRPVIDNDDVSDNTASMVGFKKASKALTVFG